MSLPQTEDSRIRNPSQSRFCPKLIRTVFRMLQWALLFHIGSSPSFGAPQLKVTADGSNLVLSWPTNAVGFRAQGRVELSVSESWSDLNFVPVATETHQYVVLPRTNAHQFFRLFKEGGTNPSINALTLSTNTVPFGSNAVLKFDIIEPDVDLAALELSWTNVLGSFSNIMSANTIGLADDVTHAELGIRPEKLPVGTSYFTLRLVDRMGLYSQPVHFQITIAGQGGPESAPQLLTVEAEFRCVAAFL